MQQNIDKIVNKDFNINLNTKSLKAGYNETSKELITFNQLLNKSFNLDTGKVNLNNIDFKKIFELVEQGVIGELVSIDSADGDHVTITVE